MASVVRQGNGARDDARSLLRDLFRSEEEGDLPSWSSRSCESTFTPCQTRDPIERLHTISISTMPSSLTRARISGSCTQSWGR